MGRWRLWVVESLGLVSEVMACVWRQKGEGKGRDEGEEGGGNSLIYHVE
jgi:hypothetical protein